VHQELAVNEPQPKSSYAQPATLFMVLWHALALAGLCYELLVRVPARERVFRDLNIALPPLTKGVIGASRWVGDYVFVLGLVVPALLAADALIQWRLNRRSWALGWLWFGLIFAAGIACAGAVEFALREPLIKAVEDLAR
jgi:type II secretory pathway component PulF